MQTLTTLRPGERRIFYLLVISAAVVMIVLVGRIVADGSGAATLSGESTARTAVQPSPEEVVARMRAALQANPDNADTYAGLGLALLQQVRLTADPALYSQAETALNEALRRNPQQLDALIGQGQLALARHDFHAALDWGLKAREAMPYRAEALGILVDAQVELGRYDEAVHSAQDMVDLRPSLSSYGRVSYIRELHGDTAGAIAAMQAAVGSGTPGTETMAWTQVQLGHLYFNSGDLAMAEQTYREALALLPDYPFAQVGLARLLAAGGKYNEAIANLESIVARLPMPEFLNTLGQLYAITGQNDKAEEQYDLIRVIQQLNANSGINVDLELALFEANHGDPALALNIAHRAFEQRPSIYASDVLAWAEYRSGDYPAAQRDIEQAMRLGTQDALLFYHAGMISAALGQPAQAIEYLDHALELNPYFDFVQARTAAETRDALK